MSKTKRRRQAVRRAQFARPLYPLPQCSNCGQPGSHFVPPSLGEPGFYYCSASRSVAGVPE